MAEGITPSTTRIKPITYSIIFALCIILRLALAHLSYGYVYDMGCFIGWSDELSRYGIGAFYENTAFCDYPCGYLYILYALSFITIGAKSFIVKLPAIAFDALGGALLWRKTKSPLSAVIYLLLPSTVADGALWGQMDSVCAFFLLASLVALQEKKYIKSAVLFALGVACKMQMLMALPVYLIVIVFAVWHDRGALKKVLLAVGAAAATLYALFIPFTGFDVRAIVRLYTSTMSSYPLASFNAFNFFALFGANGASAEGKFLFLTYDFWGKAAIVGMFILCFFLYKRSKKGDSVIFLCALFLCGVFEFSAMMHERYLFCAQILFFAAWGLSKNRKVLISAALCALSQSINILYVYYCSLSSQTLVEPSSRTLILGSVVTLAAFIYALYTYIDVYIAPVKIAPLGGSVEKRITRLDGALIAAFIAVGAVASFYNLGDSVSPKTLSEEYDLCSFEKTAVSEIVYYPEICEEPFYVSMGNGDIEIMPESCFRWARVKLDTPQYTSGASLSNAAHIFEVAFLDESGNIIAVSGGSAFDEQSLVPSEISFKNGMYFDEIYHARSAYEYLNSLPIYETTHPPLGKLLIALSMRVFGNTPFAWRFPSALCATLTIALIYLFAKRLFGSSYAAFLASALYMCDFCRISLSRIATLDAMSVFFIIGALYFLYRYYEDSHAADIALCAVFLGLACAVKWTGFYIVPMVLFVFIRKRPKAQLWLCTLIPVIIYIASHIGTGDFVRYQFDMLSYHSLLTESHPYASAWAQWPLCATSVFTELGEGGIRLVMLGNIALYPPLVAAVFIASLIRDRRLRFLLGAASSLYLPWIFIGRVSFLYHFAPTAAVLILVLVYLLLYLKKKYALSYCALNCALTAIFAPLIWGIGGNTQYLQWFDRWIF